MNQQQRAGASRAQSPERQIESMIGIDRHFNLTPQDVRAFEASGIPLELQKFYGLRRVSDEVGAAIVGQKRVAGRNLAGIVFPIYSEPGSGQHSEFELRRDEPDKEKKNGEEKETGKYLRPPGKSFLSFPPDATPEECEDVSIPVLLCEGTKKMMAADYLSKYKLAAGEKRRFLPVAVSGVYGLRGKVGKSDGGQAVKGLLTGFQKLQLKHRVVIIVFDNDTHTNFKVKYARHQAGQIVQSEKQAVVYFVDLPKSSEKIGLDDLIGVWTAEGGAESALQKCLDLLETKYRFTEEIKSTVASGKLIIGVSPAERKKCKVSAKDKDGETLAVDTFNLSEAVGRNKFIKQIDAALTLSDSEKAEVIRELLKLADAAGMLTYKPAQLAENFELIEEGGSKAAGVYYVDENGKTFICSPLEILAVTRTHAGENYGKLLRWADPESKVKTWAMPSALLYGDGNEVAKYLAHRGLTISTNRSHLDKLKSYINLSKPQEKVVSTIRLGWNDDVFVFPDETIGTSKDAIVYQPEYAPEHKFAVEGTLKEWQDNISKYCVGNSRLTFGVSLAFASVLLPRVGMQGGGFHNRGGTSSGKTTVGIIAGSVFGGSKDDLNYCQSWKSTANGLESVAEIHNHSLLCLDELAQIDGRQAADIAYMLANGRGKIRQSKNITGRRSLAWQLLFLSTGEISLADKMNEVGLKIKGGQDVRLLDIPADTCKFGVFDDLHEFPDGQSFADYLRSASHKYYGSAIRDFLEKFIDAGLPGVQEAWTAFKDTFILAVLPKDKKYPSEVFRAADRFALVAFAGETATKLQVTNWQRGEASKQVAKVFRAWFDNRSGRGSSDAERAISQVRAFVEAHGSSRFEMLTSTDESLDTSKVINRAGFRKLNDAGELEYLFLTEVFREEVCKGFDYKFVCSVLDSRGLMHRDSTGFQKQFKYGGIQMRAYWVNSRILQNSEQLDEKTKAQTADSSK